jgi:hypothetical protein
VLGEGQVATQHHAREMRVVDARPTVEATESSPWAKAEHVRDALARAIETVAAEKGVRVLVSRSQPGVYPLSVRMTAWEPLARSEEAVVTKRHELAIAIEANPYLVHPIEYEIKLIAKGRVRQFHHWRLEPSDLEALTLFALGLGPRPLVLKKARRREFLSRLPIVSWFVERNRLIQSARPQRFTGPKVLGFAGLVLFLLGQVMAQVVLQYVAYGETAYGVVTVLGTLAMLAGAVLAIIAAAWALRRPRVYSLIKRPEIAPRALYLFDSWHTSVPGVGAHFAELVRRLEKAVTHLDPSIGQAWETHQYRTPYGFEERKRITLTKGQAVVHLHIYPFAEDAFVGWDGFLNFARWGETKPVSVSVRDGQRVEYRSLAVAAHIPTEFDLVEFNALSELVHRRIVSTLKVFLKERNIEADLDFTIIRGDRDTALKEGKSKAGRRSWRESIGVPRQEPAKT